MKKRWLLFLTVCFITADTNCKSDFCHKTDWYQQHQISDLKDKLAELKLQQAVQAKIFTVQKIADEMQLKNELNYYLIHTKAYQQELNKLLKSVTDLVEFRWTLFSSDTNDKFIGSAIVSGISTAGLMILLGMSVVRKDFIEYIFPSTVAAGLAGLFGYLGHSYYYQSQKNKEISEKLKHVLNDYLNVFNFDKPFDKHEILTGYYEFLLNEIKDSVFAQTYSYSLLLNDINKDKNAVLQ